MLSIRLRRTGTTKRPYYRVVVADSRDWRDGRFVEVLGHYDPRQNPAVVKIDQERAKYWISKGARASDTVRSLLKRTAAGGRELGAEAPLGASARAPMKDLLATFARVPRGRARPGFRPRADATDGRRVLELAVASSDRGRVIGKGGRTAAALRTVLDAVAARRGESVTLEILD